MTGDIPAPAARRGMSANPYAVTALCGFVALLDGFDLQAAAYAAPSVLSTWHITPTFLGLILSASLFGVFLGAIGISPLADRFGRKRMILLSALMFGVFSCGAAIAPSPVIFLIFRVLTGVGLGGAIPSLIGLVSDTAPGKARGRFITAMFVGLPAGSVIGGLASGPLIDAFGWRAIFWVGGILPLLLLPLLMAMLPNDARRVERPVAQDIAIGEPKLKELHFLFGAGRTRITVLLWITFFMNLLMMHVLSAWLPTLLKSNGLSARESLIAASMYHFGGIVGGVSLGQFFDRTNPIKIMVLLYAAGCFVVVGASYSAHSFIAFLPFALALGGCNIGAQVLLNAVAALVYPAEVRATGVGWALGIGRWGSILGPAAVGLLVTAGWTTQQIVLGVAIPMAIAAVAMALQPSRAAEAVARA